MKVTDHLERLIFTLLGLLLLAGGAYAILRGLSAFGDGQANASLISDSQHRFLGHHESWWWLTGTLAALILIILGLALLRRQIRAVPDPRSRPLVRRADKGYTRVDGGALTGALEDELEHQPDVEQASAKLVRGGSHPLLDLHLKVPDDADFSELRPAVEDHALKHFQTAIEADQLTARIRIRLATRKEHRLH